MATVSWQRNFLPPCPEISESSFLQGGFLLSSPGTICSRLPVFLMEKARSRVWRGSLKHRMQWNFHSQSPSQVLSFLLAQRPVMVFSTCCSTSNYTPYFFECILISLWLLHWICMKPPSSLQAQEVCFQTKSILRKINTIHCGHSWHFYFPFLSPLSMDRI